MAFIHIRIEETKNKKCIVLASRITLILQVTYKNSEKTGKNLQDGFEGKSSKSSVGRTTKKSIFLACFFFFRVLQVIISVESVFLNFVKC